MHDHRETIDTILRHLKNYEMVETAALTSPTQVYRYLISSALESNLTMLRMVTTLVSDLHELMDKQNEIISYLHAVRPSLPLPARAPVPPQPLERYNGG